MILPSFISRPVTYGESYTTFPDFKTESNLVGTSCLLSSFSTGQPRPLQSHTLDASTWNLEICSGPYNHQNN